MSGIPSLTTSSPLSQSHFLTLSLSHPSPLPLLIPSHLHPLPPTHLHLFQRNMFCQSTAHVMRVLLTNVNCTESDEKQMLCTLALMPSVHASSQVLHSTLGEEELATLGSVCGIHVSLTVRPLSPSQVRFPLRQSAYSVVMRIYLLHSFHKAFYSTCLLHIVFIDFSC